MVLTEIEIANRWIQQLREGRDRSQRTIKFLSDAYWAEARLVMDLEEENTKLSEEILQLKSKIKE